MPDQLTNQLIQRELQDPQSAWQHASSIGADPQAELIHDPANWRYGMMPFIPGSGIFKRLLEMFGSAPTPKPAAPTLGEHMAEFTPQGGEGAYNALRSQAKELIDPVERAYLKVLSRGGR